MTKIILDISPDLVWWYQEDAKRNNRSLEMSIIRVLRKHKEDLAVLDEHTTRMEGAGPSE